MLYRTTAERAQLVLLKKLVPSVFKEFHENMGHLVKSRTQQLIRDHFLFLKWKTM